MYAPVTPDVDARCNHDFPGMAVRVGKISGITAVVGRFRGFQEFRAFRYREIQHRVDFLGRVAIPGERHAPKRLRPRIVRQGHVVGKLVPWEQPDHGRAGLEERDRLASGAELSRKTKGFVEGDALAHVRDAEGDDGQTGDWLWQFLTHVLPHSSLRAKRSNPRIRASAWIASSLRSSQ